MLEPILLLLLHQDAAHGYTLLEQVPGFGLAGLHPSVIYRALNDMEMRGWLSSSWDGQAAQGPPRRVYRLTALGNEALFAWIKELEELQSRVAQILESYYRHMREGKGEHH